MDVRKLYHEDIYELHRELVESYPLLASNLTDEDTDRIFYLIEKFLDPFSYGYRNYN